MGDADHDAAAGGAGGVKNIGAEHLLKQIVDDLDAGDVALGEGLDAFFGLAGINGGAEGGAVVPNLALGFEVVQRGEQVIVLDGVYAAVVELVEVYVVGAE